MSKALLIGITGNIACGKSAVGEILAAKNYQVIDSDQVVHDIYASDTEAQKLLLKEFGTLERREIAKHIFGTSDEAKAKRKTLEAILHPRVNQIILDWQERHASQKYLFNLVPLLFEAKLESRYDKIVLVRARRDIQIKRLQNRNPDLNLQEIEARIDSQMPQNEKENRSDYLVSNDGELSHLESEVERFLAQIS